MVETVVDGLIQKRARFVSDAGRLAAIAANAPIVPEPWDERDEDFKSRFLKVIGEQCSEDRTKSPEESHEKWMETYKKMGWKYGEKRDPEAKTHPDMVPYDELPQKEKDKDEIFFALCDIARQWILL